MMKLFRIIPFLLVMMFVASHVNAEMTTEQTVIPAGQTVENVIVLGNDATINGTVSDVVVVVNGDVTLKSSAVVNGSIIVLGGKINQEKGAVARDQLISLHLNDESKNSMVLGGLLLLANWGIKLVGSMGLFLLTILTSLLLQQKQPGFLAHFDEQRGKLFATGLMASLGLAALAVLFAITVIGLPVTFILIILATVIFIVGLAVLSRKLAEQINSLNDKPDWQITAAGAAILIAFLNVPLIGLFLSLFIFTLSLGVTNKVMIEWMTSKRKKRK